MTPSCHYHPVWPRPLHLVGNFHLIIQPSPHHRLWQLSLLYGPLMSLKLGLRPALVISSAKVAEVALKHGDLEFSNRPSLFGLLKISYDGSDMALAHYGEYWRKLRRITTLHLFSAKKVQSFRAVREQEVSRMIRAIVGRSACSGMVNIGETVLPLALSIICRIAYRRDYSEEVPVRDLLREAQAALRGLFLRDYFGQLGGLVDLLREATRRLGRVCEEMDAFYEMMIDEHPHVGRLQEEENMIDVLLGNENLTIEQVKAVLMSQCPTAKALSCRPGLVSQELIKQTSLDGPKRVSW